MLFEAKIEFEGDKLRIDGIVDAAGLDKLMTLLTVAMSLISDDENQEQVNPEEPTQEEKKKKKPSMLSDH